MTDWYEDEQGVSRPSVTDMHTCPHGPIQDCHKCMFRELVQVLEGSIRLANCVMARDPFLFAREGATVLVQARAAIQKAKQIDPDCIPSDEAEEAAASQERWR